MVPAYNEAASLDRVHTRLTEVAQKLAATRALACEVIYVDDGSADDTLAIARALPASALDVQVVSLSRNFGKEAALLAGLDHARLGAVLFIDGDGQHPPELIETLVGHWLDDDYDVVYTAKAHRDEESFVRRVAVKAFYALLNSDSHVQIPENAGDFRLLSPRAAKALRQMPERNRFFKGLASWIGFRQKRIDYEPAQRAQGRSSWGLRSLIGLSLNGLTAFSVAPLRMATVLGLLLALIALIYGGKIIYETVVYGASVPGYPSLFVGVMVLGAVQLVMLGVVGEYIGKILYEIKARPVYFVAEHDVKLREEAAQLALPSLPRLRGRIRWERRRMSERHIIICADDYGISPAVSAAIRDLIARGRINATSVMVAAPKFDHDEAAKLRDVAAQARFGRLACDLDRAVRAALAGL